MTFTNDYNFLPVSIRIQSQLFLPLKRHSLYTYDDEGLRKQVPLCMSVVGVKPAGAFSLLHSVDKSTWFQKQYTINTTHVSLCIFFFNFM